MELYNEEIRKIKTISEKGGVFIYPTETVYGLGAGISNQNAVDRISKIKNRSPDKSFIILVHSFDMLRKYVTHIDDRIIATIRNHHKSVTAIYDANGLLPEYILAKDKTVGIRVVDNVFLVKLIEAIGEPIISTSANFSGEPTPINFAEIDPSLFNKVDYVSELKLESESQGAASAVVKIIDDQLVFLRQ